MAIDTQGLLFRVITEFGQENWRGGSLASIGKSLDSNVDQLSLGTFLTEKCFHPLDHLNGLWTSLELAGDTFDCDGLSETCNIVVCVCIDIPEKRRIN